MRALHPAGAFAHDLAAFFFQIVQGALFHPDSDVELGEAAQVNFIREVQPQRPEAEKLNLCQRLAGLL
ncbi:hypothetical protein [Leisingera sp. ANG-DT]|uniref:hypothetical protein n=1 Tax=Leisingera sp. ANG-DT TaxID=1577897 RepID=UPI0019D36D64|nr:hypothetical protein [Leisingera sp. ANG-DT]